MDAYLGEIRIFAGNFAPRNWAFCNGQILAISQNSALFSILGVQYGGNGTATFGLPNLQGQTVMGAGQGPGLSQHSIGETSSNSSVELIANNLPAHTHSLLGSSSNNNSASVSNAFMGSNVGRAAKKYILSPAGAANIALAPGSIGWSGPSSQPVNIMQPYLTLNYIICLAGNFPSRN